jgi:chromosome segregation ATPase
MWSQNLHVWLRMIHDKYVANQRSKINARIAEIDIDLDRLTRNIKALRLRREKLTWLRPSFERHDEFTASMVEQINDDLRQCEHLKKNLMGEASNLNIRLAKLPTSARVAKHRVSAFS